MSKMNTELHTQIKTFTSDAGQLQIVHVEAESLRAEIDSLWANVADAKDKAIIYALKAEIKLRSEMLDALWKGLTETWIVDAEKAIQARNRLLEQDGPTYDANGGHTYDADRGPHIDISLFLGEVSTANPEDGHVGQDV